MIKQLPQLSYTPDLKFNHSFLAKDCSLSYFIKHKPELESLVKELDSFLPAKEFLTIDYYEQILISGSKTCRNINWHVDGTDNAYLIVGWGDFRTQFLLSSYELLNDVDLIEKNLSIATGLKNKDLSFFEISPGIPYLYTSSQIHRGRKVTTNGKRVLLRLCRSNYLTPKNKLLNPKLQPKQIKA